MAPVFVFALDCVMSAKTTWKHLNPTEPRSASSTSPGFMLLLLLSLISLERLLAPWLVSLYFQSGLNGPTCYPSAASILPSAISSTLSLSFLLSDVPLFNEISLNKYLRHGSGCYLPSSVSRLLACDSWKSELHHEVLVLMLGVRSAASGLSSSWLSTPQQDRKIYFFRFFYLESF